MPIYHNIPFTNEIIPEYLESVNIRYPFFLFRELVVVYPVHSYCSLRRLWMH